MFRAYHARTAAQVKTPNAGRFHHFVDADGQLFAKDSDGDAVPVGLPTLPTSDDEYVLTCTVSDGAAVLTWESTS